MTQVSNNPAIPAPAVLWWVTDQLPYPPRNGVTLPSFHHARALGAHHQVRLVLLVDVANPPSPADLDENERVFGPVVCIPIRRRPKWRRLLDELRGAEMFQHGYEAAGAAPSVPLKSGDRLLVTPMSAVAKLRGSAALDPSAASISLALVNDCTAGEYHYRLQERAGDMRHALKGALDRWRSRGIGAIEQRLLSRYTHVLLQTERDAQIFGDLVSAKLVERVRITPNGVNDALFSQPRGEGRVIVFMAELSGEYGPIARWLVADVWPRLSAGPWQLLVVGKGASPELKQLLDGTPGVRHESFVPRLESVYEDAAIAISPVFKGFGLINKTLEAMAAGVPVVGGLAAFNGIDGFVPGRHGIVCGKADAREFADALGQLMADDAQRHSIGSAGRELVSKGFRWQAASAGIERLLTAGQGAT